MYNLYRSENKNPLHQIQDGGDFSFYSQKEAGLFAVIWQLKIKGDRHPA